VQGDESIYDQYQPEMNSKFLFLGPRYIGDNFFFRADRSLGAKQEGLTIVHFLNKLIVSCKEAVWFSFYFFFLVIVNLDSYFLFKLKGYFQVELKNKEKIIKNNEEKNPKLLFVHVHVYV
jgi:hypothetical protein